MIWLTVLIGVYFTAVGVAAFFFNKYPHRESILEKLEKKYGMVDEDKLGKCEGVNNFIYGIVILCFAALTKVAGHSTDILATITLIILLISTIVYYKFRKKYLGISK